MPSVHSMTHSSVTMSVTQLTAVRGMVHFFRILGSPFLVQCSRATMTFLVPATRSMAPPMPFTTLPGTIQLARLNSSSTCRPPRMVASRWPPLAMAKDTLVSKQQAPGIRVHRVLLALHSSA